MRVLFSWLDDLDEFLVAFKFFKIFLFEFFILLIHLIFFFDHFNDMGYLSFI